ncbi:MAG: response regulator [Leptolyngbyaceae bacterium]|nr:response regulator [Leptolyngbyaceae bacterium]
MQESAEILAVDDTPANLEVITETLSAAGYTVAATTSGERALKRLQTYVPDLILLDVQMPGMDGFETCRQIRANPSLVHVPIIFVTAFSDTANIVRGFSMGGIDYICKPFQESELLARVNTHLQLKRMNETLEKQVSERTRELEDALEQLKQSQIQLVQQEKMTTLGSLVAGIAHELNNPVGFLTGNIEVAKEYAQNLLDLIQLLLEKASPPDEEVSQKIKAIDLEFVRQDLPQLLDSMNLGIDRIYEISNSLRTFSRSDKTTKSLFDLHDGLDSTLLILRHRLKADGDRPAIGVMKYYGDIPHLSCFPGQINQVFMNILANAIDALEDQFAATPADKMPLLAPQITIRTTAIDRTVSIHFQDNGVGMSDATQQKIFDYLYTTKTVGKGTGLGLAIAKQIVTEVHGGTISVQSELGKGTEFCIQLPFEAEN